MIDYTKITEPVKINLFGYDAKAYRVLIGDSGRATSRVVKLSKGFREGRREKIITVTMQFDDRHCNGHETFSITAEIRVLGAYDIESGGCLHEEIAKHFPALQPVIKWHLTSTDGPMYYIANTVYWARQGNLRNARSCAVWHEASDHDLRVEGLQDRLQGRLPGLLEEFSVTMRQIFPDLQQQA